MTEQLFENTPYKNIGGKEVIEQLVNDFYHIMQTDPKARECLLTHTGRDIQDSAEKLKDFLSGWLGGPALYLEKYGHPRLRMRHFPFSIGEAEASQWLYCMQKALEKSTIATEVQAGLMEAFANVTKVIRNRD